MAPAHADVGAGVMLGDPSGLSGKLWLDGRRAIDAGLAYSLNDYLLVQGDYLLHFGDMSGTLRSGEAFVRETRPYAGIGAALYLSTIDTGLNRVGFRKSGYAAGLAVRIPFGFEWRRAPIGVFVELAPGIGILPSTFTLLNGSVGVRYYFR